MPALWRGHPLSPCSAMRLTLSLAASTVGGLAAGMADLLVSNEYGRCVSSGNGRFVS